MDIIFSGLTARAPKTGDMGPRVPSKVKNGVQNKMKIHFDVIGILAIQL